MVKISSLLSTLTLLIICLGCTHRNNKKQSTPPPLNIEYAVVESQPLSEPIWFATTLEPIRSVTIEPRVNGYVGAIHFSGGDHIAAGTKIFTIDPSLLNTSLLAAEAELESARAQLIEAENNYNRALPLSEINAISKSSLDQYRASYQSAKATVRSAQETLRSAQLNISYATITAPFDGIIAESPAALGDYVGPGTVYSTLTTISDTETIKVQLAIPTARYLRHNGTSDNTLLSDITLILPDSSHYPIKAQYDYTNKDATPNSSTVVIVATIPNPDGILKPNMFARIKAAIGSPKKSLTIPQSAVTQMQGVNSVWVIAPDSTVSFRLIELGATINDQWIITSGVKEGEKVATTAQLKLHQGAKVNPVTNKSK